jgi:hypothetical protein
LKNVTYMSVTNPALSRFRAAYSALEKNACAIAYHASFTLAPRACTRAASAAQKALPPASGLRCRIER